MEIVSGCFGKNPEGENFQWSNVCIQNIFIDLSSAHTGRVDFFPPFLSLRDVEKLGSQMRKSAIIQQQSIKTEWKLAKIAFVVIIVFVLSWSPYACVTLIAWAG